MGDDNTYFLEKVRQEDRRGRDQYEDENADNDLMDWYIILEDESTEALRDIKNLRFETFWPPEGEPRDCPGCSGTGRIGHQGSSECPHCSGTGEIPEPDVDRNLRARAKRRQIIRNLREELVQMAALCRRIDQWIKHRQKQTGDPVLFHARGSLLPNYGYFGDTLQENPPDRPDPQPGEPEHIRTRPTPEPHVVISHTWRDVTPEYIFVNVVEDFLPEYKLGEVEWLSDRPRVTFEAHSTHWARIFDALCNRYNARWKHAPGDPPQIFVEPRNG